MISSTFDNLKSLSIENVQNERSQQIFGIKTEWMLPHYSIYFTKPYDCTALMKFFRQNPNIQTFSINRAFILSNHQSSQI